MNTTTAAARQTPTAAFLHFFTNAAERLTGKAPKAPADTTETSPRPEAIHQAVSPSKIVTRQLVAENKTALANTLSLALIGTSTIQYEELIPPLLEAAAHWDGAEQKATHALIKRLAAKPCTSTKLDVKPKTGYANQGYSLGDALLVGHPKLAKQLGI